MIVSDLLEVWAAALVRASWQGGLIVLSVWMICRLVPSLPARFQAWLWRLAVLKFVVAFVWSVPLELPLLPARKVIAWSQNSPLSMSPHLEEGAAFVQYASPGVATPWLILFTIWAVVFAWQSFRIFLACREARRLRDRCRPCHAASLHAQLSTLSRSAGLRTPPTLLEMNGLGSPLLVGIFRPAIVLPSSTLGRLDNTERALVLGHELAHACRGDLFWNLIVAGVRAVFFFHPLAWLCERQLRLSQEIAADELAISLQHNDAVGYARSLVSFVCKLDPARVLPTMSVGAAGSQQSLQRRLFAMRFVKPVSRPLALVYGVALATVAVLGVVPWTLVAAEQQTADKAEPKQAIYRGNFVSFKEGILRIKGEDGKEFDAIKVADGTKVIGHIKGVEKEGTTPDAFKIWEPGAVIAVTVKDRIVTFVEIGIKKGVDKVPDRAPDKAAGNVSPKTLFVWGKFKSFQDGALTIQANSGALLENKIPTSAKVMVWNHDEGVYKPATTAQTLSRVEVGTWTIVNAADENVTVRLGARKGSTTGTFVSFKGDRLLMLGKNLGESFTKKYGNNLHFNKFREDVPVYESIDGGEYQLIGTANKVLGDVKEGTVVTVHGEGDDNITLVQIGEPKKQ